LDFVFVSESRVIVYFLWNRVDAHKQRTEINTKVFRGPHQTRPEAFTAGTHQVYVSESVVLKPGRPSAVHVQQKDPTDFLFAVVERNEKVMRLTKPVLNVLVHNRVLTDARQFVSEKLGDLTGRHLREIHFIFFDRLMDRGVFKRFVHRCAGTKNHNVRIHLFI
jgi:hypothetical protein